MLIDDFLPIYDKVERHYIEVRAPAERVYAAVRALDVSGSPVVRWLFRLRGGLPLTLDRLLKGGFNLLAEDPPRELLIGVAGRFWRAHGDVQRLDAAGFRAFATPGFARAAWNFSIAPNAGAGSVRLSTETRVQCFGRGTRRAFSLYWFFIRPFSGWIRIEALRSIQRHAERP